MWRYSRTVVLHHADSVCITKLVWLLRCLFSFERCILREEWVLVWETLLVDWAVKAIMLLLSLYEETRYYRLLIPKRHMRLMLSVLLRATDGYTMFLGLFILKEQMISRDEDSEIK